MNTTCANCGQEVVQTGINTIGVVQEERHRVFVRWSHEQTPIFRYECEAKIARADVGGGT